MRYPLTDQSSVERSTRNTIVRRDVLSQRLRPRRQGQEMRTLCWLLLLVFLCIQTSAQRINETPINSEEKSEISVNNGTRHAKDEYSKRNKEAWNMKKLQELLRQATNSTSNTTSQVTVTRQGPCQCGGGACGCCSRILFDTWKQKACVNVTYDPDEFSFTARIMMNDRILYTRTVSGTFVHKILGWQESIFGLHQ
ncbi:hypothetical protein WN48_10208 [Eufriesea mexicana]|nr:hypothetical protein WN48_10208 [Eufriesea mexicana]